MSGVPPEVAEAIGVDPARARLLDLPGLAKFDMESVEDQLRVATIQQAKGALLALVAMLGEPKVAPRALHLIGETAVHYQALLTVLGLGGTQKVQRQSGLYGSMPAQGLMEVAPVAFENSNGGLSGPDVQPGGETFANQALGQILAMAKQFIHKDKPSAGSTGWDVEALTRALGEAKQANLSHEILDGIEARLKAALAPGPADPEPVAVEPESPPSPSPGPAVSGDDLTAAGFLTGFAAGLQPIAPGAEE